MSILRTILTASLASIFVLSLSIEILSTTNLGIRLPLGTYSAESDVFRDAVTLEPGPFLLINDEGGNADAADANVYSRIFAFFGLLLTPIPLVLINLISLPD